ncbi:MAG: WYL domain-containing protein [Pseudomonadota bacterium]
MPSDSSRNTLARQWELLKLLPSHRPGKTAAELTRNLAELGYDVTKRTVERDLDSLVAVFPTIECNDKGQPYGWHWAPGASSDVPGVTLAEALSLQMIEETLKPLLPASVLKAVEPRFRQAANKLASQKQHPGIARWADKVRNIPPALPLLPPRIDLAVLETVQSALLGEVQLEVDYHSMDAEAPQTRTLHPLAMVQRGPVTYLVATAYGYEDIRLYALHRISRAERLAERSKKPKTFDIDQYIQAGHFQFSNGKSLTLKARIVGWLARILGETPLSEDQTLIQDGDEYLLTAHVADSWQLRWWILSQGPSITVIEPKYLVNETKQSLANSFQLYEDK